MRVFLLRMHGGGSLLARVQHGTTQVRVKVDCANGVGAPQFAPLAASLGDVLDATLCNDGACATTPCMPMLHTRAVLLEHTPC